MSWITDGYYRELTAREERRRAEMRARVGQAFNCGARYEGRFAVYSSEAGLVAFGVGIRRAIRMAKKYTVGSASVATMSGTELATYRGGRRVKAGRRTS